jgi:iron(III) transport system substrate-binding protein
VHDVITEAVAGFPVAGVTPCEGTGYEIGSLSIVNGARNLDGARKFADWALTAPAQSLGARSKQFQTPSNRSAEIPKEAPRLTEIKLIDYDFKKYGSSAERRRILDKWDKEVNALPR